MGRKRKDNSLGLPERVYLRSGTFYYVHRDTGAWENIGKDLAAAKKRGEHHNDTGGTYGTMAWYIDQFIIDCELRVKASTLKQRTLDDYLDALPALKAFFGKMLPPEVEPNHVNEFLEIGLRAGRAVRANREKAALSSCMSWMLRSKEHNARLIVNPCMRKSGVRRNPESKRELYVEDAWYHATYAAAGTSVQIAMELVYRTLQRPEVDVLAWTPANVKAKAGGRVLHFRQSKTGRLIDIALVGRLGDLVRQAIGEVPRVDRRDQPLVHRLDGRGYTYDGLCSNLKKAQDRARAAAKKAGEPQAMPSWGLRDLKGKGATDMYFRQSIPVQQIQMLCGHADERTTMIYIKARWRETAQPNNAEIGR